MISRITAKPDNYLILKINQPSSCFNQAWKAFLFLRKSKKGADQRDWLIYLKGNGK